MAQDWYNLLSDGGGLVEWVFFIHGLPWAACSNQSVATALSNPSGVAAQRTYRKWLFGKEAVTVDATTTTPSDTIPIFPILSKDIGGQSIRFDEGKQLQGGDWSVTLDGQPLGYTWTHRSGTLWGLEGLDVIPSSAQDSTICEARLSRLLPHAGAAATVLYFDNDVGGKLKEKIDANFATDTPTYIWIGTEVVIAYTATVSDGDGEYHCSVVRGAWKTTTQRHDVEDYESAAQPISDAPTFSISGRPATLYAVPMAEDGTILDITDEPVRLREGPCLPASAEHNGTRKVSAGFKKRWFDYDIRANYAEAHIRGYLFSRQSGSSGQSPHLVLKEWNGAAWTTFDVWLCAAGDSVFFENYEDLCTYVGDAIAGLATTESYIVDHDLGPVAAAAITDTSRYPKLGGPLPEILGWGALRTIALPKHLDGLTSAHPWWSLEADVDDVLSDDDWCLTVFDDADGHEAGFDKTWCNFGRARYFLQWGWNVDPAAALASNEGPKRVWVCPEETSDSSYRIYLSLDDDATTFAAGDVLTIGSADNVQNDRPMIGIMEVEATDGTDNYIDLENNTYSLALQLPGETTYPVVATQDGDTGPFTWAYNFMWHPFAFGANDPWVIRQNFIAVAEDGNPTYILRGLLNLGSPSTTIPAQFRIYHIPDLADDMTDAHSQFHEGWDWDKLAELTSASFPSMQSQLALNDTINFQKIYDGMLAFYGISETYEYCEAIKGFRVSYRPTGIVSINAASNAGRVVDSTVRLSNTNPTNVTANTWLYDKIDAKFNYDAANDKYGITLTTEDKQGRARGPQKTLKIEDRLSHFGELTDSDLDIFRQHFGSIIKRLSIPAPEQKVKCNIGAWARLAVGREALVTDTTARNPYTWALGLTRTPVLVTAMNTYANAKTSGVDVTYRFAPNAVRGWAPAIYLAAAEITLNSPQVDIVMAHSTPATQNDFADPNGGLTDLQYFDCWQYNVSTDTVEAKDCSCSDYAVQIFDVDVTTYDQAAPGRNHWTGTMAVTSATAAAITLDNDDNFDDSTDKIVIFDTHDNCEACQQDYLFFGDSGGEVGAADIVAGKWA